jgi:transcriptional regulator with XRE-family HTH domain
MIIHKRDHGLMSKMKLNPAYRRLNPLSAWRDAHGLTLARLAEKVGMSTGAVFQVEDQERGNYTRAWLEALAQLYNCEPADIVRGPPGEGDELNALWRRLTPDQRQKVIAYAEGMLAEQAPPPAAEPPPPAASPADTVTSRLKPQPVDKIGGRRPLHVYLAQWLESRGWEPVDLAKRVNVPGAVPDAIEGLISGKYGYDQEWLYEIAKALGVAMEKLYELPPARAKLATKGGKRQSTRR